MAASVPRLVGDALAREMNLRPLLVSSQYIHEERIPKFGSWIGVVPYFSHRGRWIAYNWNAWDGRSYNVEFMDARFRELLRKTGIEELYAYDAARRARASLPHERGLKDYIAAGHELRYLARYGSIKLAKIAAEFNVIHAMLNTSPPHIYALFHDNKEKLGAFCTRILEDMNDLHDIWVIQAERTEGLEHFKNAISVFKLNKRRSAIQRQSKVEKHGLRRLGKLAHRASNLHNIEVTEERSELREFFENAHNSVDNATYIDRRQVNDLIAQYRTNQYARQPLQWYTEEFFRNYLRISTNWRQVTKSLYVDLLFRADKDMNFWQNEQRHKLFRVFRNMLNAWLYELPTDLDHPWDFIFPLLVEHRSIRRYQAEHFPESISQEDLDCQRRYLGKSNTSDQRAARIVDARERRAAKLSDKREQDERVRSERSARDLANNARDVNKARDAKIAAAKQGLPATITRYVHSDTDPGSESIVIARLFARAKKIAEAAESESVLGRGTAGEATLRITSVLSSNMIHGKHLSTPREWQRAQSKGHSSKRKGRRGKNTSIYVQKQSKQTKKSKERGNASGCQVSESPGPVSHFFLKEVPPI